MSSSMATRISTQGRKFVAPADGHRVLALWLLWLALFAILLAAGVVAFGNDPATPKPQHKPQGTPIRASR
jgi:hypothetical protein